MAEEKDNLLVPYDKHEKKPLRKKIVKLCKVIGGKAGMMNKIDENAPEYYCLAGSLSDEEADFGIAMGLRKHRTVDYMAKKLGKSKEEVRKIGEHMAYLGVIRYDKDPKTGDMTFYLPIFAPGLMEMMVVSPNAKLHPEIYRAFNQYTHDRLRAMGPMLPEGFGLMRVIPIERALPKGEPVDDRDRVSYYLNKYDYFSIGACSCRTSRTNMGDGCGHMAKDRCLKLGGAARFFVDSGKEHAISREEAKAILEECEDEGLMHSIPNVDGAGGTTAICDCCGCACFGLRPVEEFKTNIAVASNYHAEVNVENCVACGKCVENCPVNAIKLGESERLHVIHPIEIKGQKQLAYHTVNAAERNPNYRFNRTDVVETGTAPCKVACPAHIGVQGYIRLAGEGRYREALELIKHENPFPAVCGRICSHPCEQQCSRNYVDSPVAIDDIKKFIADKELDEKNRFVPKVRHDFHGKHIAVIGAGPSGLSCAYFLGKLGYSVTVFEREEKLGGMLTLGIPSFRLEKDIINAEIDVLRKLGVEFKTGVEVGKDVTIPELRKQGYNAFYVAIGAQDSRKLGLPKEDDEHIVGGINFLRDINLGHGMKLNGDVVVVGGGNVAMDVARSAIRQGASKVHLYCLEQRKEMPASADEIEEAEEEGIEVHNGWGPKEVKFDKDGRFIGLDFKKCTRVRDPETHRFSPLYDENTVEFAKADSVLLAIGQSYHYGDLFKDTKVEFNRNGTVKADLFTRQTAEPDIFVGGDCFHGPSFAINAIADGKEGCTSLHRFVQPGQLLDAGRDRRDFAAIDKDNVDFSGYDKMPRQHPAMKKLANPLSYEDPRGTLTEEQVQKEAKRCLGCGRAYVDLNMCVGCGQCVLQCKFDAAHLVKNKKMRYASRFEKILPKAAGYTVKRGIKIAFNALKRED